MRPKFLKMSVATALLALSGCATMSNWQPTIDAQNDPHKDRIYTDLAECKHLAERASDVDAGSVAKSTVVGGAVGAAAGAAVGAAAGDAGKGAAVGAATGGFGTGIYKAVTGNEEYKHAYIKCMEQRGHKVLNG